MHRPINQGITRSQRCASDHIHRDFTRNDYLGMAQHPEVIAACQQAAAQGIGSAGSALVCGYSQAHRDCENAFAQWLGFERALLVSNGYLANHMALQALGQRQSTVIADKHIHASIIDACQAYQIPLKRYPHQDMKALERQLQSTPGNKLLVTEGIFSTYGSQTPLTQLHELCQRYGATLMLDDAHGIGVLAQGLGSLRAASLKPQDIKLLCCPLGKAFGSFGAILLGCDATIHSIIQHSRIYRYSTALPAYIASVNHAALHQVQQADAQRECLQANIAHFRTCAVRHGLMLGEAHSPIQPVYFDTMNQALHCQKRLQHHKLNTYVMTPPTVPEQRCLIRITLNSHHTASVIETLSEVMGHV